MGSDGASDLQAVLDALDEAVLLIAADGPRVSFANRRAREVLAPRDGVAPDLEALLGTPPFRDEVVLAAVGENRVFECPLAAEGERRVGPDLPEPDQLGRETPARLSVSLRSVETAAGGWVVAVLRRFDGVAEDGLATAARADELLGQVQTMAADLMGRERTASWGLRALIDAADELIRCEDLDTLCRRGVELARERLGLERCTIFLLDSSGSGLRGTYGTDEQGHTTDERDHRMPGEASPLTMDASDLWTVRASEHVFWRNGRPHLIGSGWVAATLIRSVAAPVGVLFNDTARSGAPLNEAVQETVAVYCSLLGNIIDRLRSQERQQSMTRAFNAILEAADELITCRDMDTFERRVVELAREKLGVERCGLWLLDAAQEFFTGTYGTDPQGRTVDEHGGRWPAHRRPEIFARDARRLITDQERAYWERDVYHSVGPGWVAQTFIRSGDEFIGLLTNDSHLTQSPLDEPLQEALTIYCTLVGNMLKRMRAEAERELLIAELENKNAELERFTYSVSHDLKSPLITIRGFLSFLEKDAAGGKVDRLRGDVARIVDATTKMQQLLDELLELSRIGRIMNPPEELAFEDVVNDALTRVHGQIVEHEASVTIMKDLPRVRGDRVRLVEVVQNLVDNALKFMGDQPTPLIEIGWRQDESGPAFFVRDNGIGIDSRYHERVFGLFNKLDASSSGTGVGLALVKRIVEVHGGRIWIESAGPGKGTTFWFALGGR